MSPSHRKPNTLLTHLGREPKKQHGAVNPPVYHASTILFEDVESLRAAKEIRMRPDAVTYGRMGTPTTMALQDSVAALEGGYAGIAVSSGLAAVTASIMSFVQAGDHVLMTDSVYGPARAFCDSTLAKFGVETTYYDPLIGSDIASLIRENTKIVFTESPGSQTFEVQDIPAIAEAAHAAGAAVLMDNTWGTPLYCKSFELGVDVSIHAGTKYIVGHSDAMLGIIVTSQAFYEKVRRGVMSLGHSAAPDDVFLGLRGFRTLSVRLEQHHKNGVALATWLQQRPEVARVMHPALPDDPGHELWKRDFSGACGLFGLVLHPVAQSAVDQMLNHLELYGMGYSWGGFESLIVPTDPRSIRTATDWNAQGPSLRIHAGLEDIDDLIADLEAGFERLNRAVAAE
ncbi:cystathionine beta-lyase [Denitrobaculum tricleocarpae]|uniref:Cystathionine beta-lyase n=1 Tax=Denitrobaculum tricleocarpae TaxID=2591009 RepID=A0A545TQF7_9PROT|nr:cystathionine beta-lyase [Denitrobaculum tricleocarpae]TQV79351.1 cystathionine beta-lyase [Denitrobaculum tricleocarpae]